MVWMRIRRAGAAYQGSLPVCIAERDETEFGRRVDDKILRHPAEMRG